MNKVWRSARIIYVSNFNIDAVKKIRKDLNITQHDFSKVFDISIATLQKLEYGVSRDTNVLKLLEIYFSFPEVAVWQIKQNWSTIPTEKKERLIKYFKDV